MARRGSKGDAKRDVALENFIKGSVMVEQHPMFAPLEKHSRIIREGSRWFPNLCPEAGWALVSDSGTIHVHPTRRAEPEEWAYVLAHCLLHLGFGHFQEGRRQREWTVACDCFIARFLNDLKFGRPIIDLSAMHEVPAQSEERLYESFCENGISPDLLTLGTAGPGMCDMTTSTGGMSQESKKKWQACFGQGLALAVASAINVAAGYESSLGVANLLLTPAIKARNWFISSYPLLGSLAAGFEIIEDPQLCMRLGISVAAVDPESKEIFMNPAAGMDEDECRFVMAHELLHVGLRHDVRRQGRDPWLWNVACDYVINGWLVEMGLGELPKLGALYDVDLKGESAEAIYGRMAVDMRRYRRLCTLAGVGICDILDRGKPDWWRIGEGIALDDFYRRCLSQGLVYHQDQGRGFLPAGLVEEIRALSQPAISWDVELAQWFDDYFSPLEKMRSYARPSRRQSSTPDIPRPRYTPVLGSEDGRTFGVVLDTSGSMDRVLLAKALGAIASYSISRDVPQVRVVFCDAAAYDQGYMPPEDISDRVKVRGRGGTVLQPGIDMLDKADDFPEDGPLLIITDGYCDRLRIKREHAFLVPEGQSLPFVPRGKVFRIR